LKLKWFISICLITVALATVIGCQSAPPDEAKSEDIARSFLKNSPTFNFDGISGSIKLVMTNGIGNDEWVLTYEFENAHPGYGDRSGFGPIPGKTTRHTAEIVVVRGKVVPSYIDGKWDMKRQAYLDIEDQYQSREPAR